MANPYEGIDQSLLGEVQNLDIDPTAVTEVITDTVNTFSGQNMNNSAEGSNSTELALDTSTKKVDNYATRKAQNDARNAWQRLPDGPEKDAAANKWAMDYHGMSYPEYEAKRKKESSDQFYSYLHANSAVFGPTLGIPGIPSVESPINTCIHKKL